MSFFARSNLNERAPTVVNIRCPYCRHQGAFHGRQQNPDMVWNQNHPATQGGNRCGGIRLCPNPSCKGIVFVVFNQGTAEILRAFPPETIDFDASNLPEKILASLEEAVNCHSAGCYKSTALMVRRLLEELCEDRNVGGQTLNERVRNLKTSAVLPPELLDAANELRLLGNDAAHVEAKSYDAIGKREAEVAIVLAKELLKAVYQYISLVDQLKALKAPDP